MAKQRQELWSGFGGKGLFARMAENAKNDGDGNEISQTYATRAASATSGHISSLDASGNPADSGLSSDILASKTAASGGSDLSMVTTGEKYVWNDWSSASVVIPPANGVTIGGRKYEYRQFGNTLWMMESLKYDPQDSSVMVLNQPQGVYYYKAEYLAGQDFTSILPAGWHIPTSAERNALIEIAGGSNADGARYMFSNFNVETSSMYNGYGDPPGAYGNDWQFMLFSYDGSSTAKGFCIDKSTPPELQSSDNLGGNGMGIFVPVRLCKAAT